MDLLRKEMERKKRALAQAKQGAAVPVVGVTAPTSQTAGNHSRGDDSAPGSSSSSTRYLNAGQLRRLQEAEEERLKLAASSRNKRPRTNPQQEEEVKESSSLPQRLLDGKAPSGSDNVPAPAVSASDEAQTALTKRGDDKAESLVAAKELPSTSSSSVLVGVDSATISNQLRSLGLEVRLFGERGDDTRLVRLQRAMTQQQSNLKSLSEKQEFRLGAGHTIRNPFLDQDKRSATTTEAHRPTSKAGKTKKEEKVDNDDDDRIGDEDGNDDENDPHKRIYAYLKSLLQEWEHDLSLRPESVRSSVAGKRDTNTLQQCQDYIAPLFKLLKKRKLESSLTTNLAKIVEYCRQGEFVRANDAYMDIAIGRAAWPIGVTQVGIHSRTGRSKIESSNVAHVMNSELQRKYLTSVKRLITYAQAKSTADPSKKVLN